ncbi:MAG: hypothetical protein ABFD50_06810 [Smithella sp.]
MAAKKNHRRSNSNIMSARRAMTYAKVRILKATYPQRELSQIREIIAPRRYSELIEWINTQPNINKRFLPSPFPSAPDQMMPFRALDVTSLKNELYWCCSYINPHLPKLNQYLRCRLQLDQAFLASDEDECMRYLDEMQKEFGYSLWLIKKSIVILHEIKGLNEQKAYWQRIESSKIPFPNIAMYIAYYVSFRSESSVSPSHFMSVYDSALLKNDLPSGIEAYVRHHITGIPANSIDNIASLLSLESLSPAIDSYEMLIASSQMIVARNYHTLFPILFSLLTELATKIQDHRISRLLFFLSKGEEQGELSPCKECRFTDFLKAHTFSKQIYCYHPAAIVPNAQALIMSSLSGIKAGEEAQEIKDSNRARYQQIVQHLRSVLTVDDKREEARVTLIRIAWSLEGSEYAALIRTILTAEGIASKTAGIPAYEPLYLALGLNRLCPLELWWITDLNTRSTILTAFADAYPTQSQLWIYYELDSSPAQLPIPPEPLSSPVLWRKMAQALRQLDYEIALQTANLLKDDSHPLFRIQSMYAIAVSLRQLGRIEECVNFLAERIVYKPALRTILPVLETFLLLNTEIKTKMANNLSFAVLTDFYVELSGTKYIHLRSYAAEDFIAALSLKRPSQLRDHITKLNKTLLIHFLRSMCTEEVMDSWIEFSSSHEVARERALVCQLLIDLDSANTDKDQSEIRDIMQKLTLSKRLREVEQSKIYVDIKGIKNAAKESLEEDYARYMTFVKHGMSSEDRYILDTARQQFDRGDIEAILATAFPRNEMSTLFNSMVIRLRDEFVSSSQHGLDGYLSVRIRHGTLAGQLRGPLESEHLLTLKDAKTKKYLLNSEWPSELGLYDDRVKDQLQIALSTFADRFDSFVEEIRTTWIQVKKTTNNIGLMDFTLLQTEVDFLSTLMQPDMTFDAFLDQILGYFFREKLTPALETVRLALQNKAKPQISNLLLELQATVEQEVSSPYLWKLRAALARAGTNMQIALDRITEWFHLPQAELVNEPFSLNEAVDISALSIQLACPDFEAQLSLSSELEDLAIEGNLPSFIDLLFLAFENIVRHSEAGHLTIAEVAASLEDSVLSIRVENDIGKTPPSPNILQRVAKLHHEVQNNVFSQSIKREGGTGFLKMQKILHHDFRADGGKTSLDFGFIEGNRFFVDLKIPIKIEEWEDHESINY